MNAARAFEDRDHVRLVSVSGPGPAPAARFFERLSSTPTRATIAWHRHVRYDLGGTAEPRPLNNVDLLLYERNSGELRDASTSVHDNVEQVSNAVAEGAVLVVVGGESLGTADTVALAHSGGFVSRTGPGVAVALERLSSPTPASTFTVTALVRNTGDLRAFGSGPIEGG